MNKEFVTYEIDLELKELGFNEPCFGVYATKDGYVRKSAYDENGDAPTYSQAFRFFREKYELFHSIFYQDDNSGPGSFDYEILNKRGKSQGDDEYLEFDTYEEAELASLKKLIEIVKNK
jgi:hypothetical protein